MALKTERTERTRMTAKKNMKELGSWLKDLKWTFFVVFKIIEDLF